MSNPYRSPPYNNNFLPDCSQPICTAYCPQWCYIIIPPPPPSSFGGAINFSLLIVALIGILTGAFLLISYYTIISKYCKRTTRRSYEDPDLISAFQSDLNHPPQSGLDEATIKSIRVCKYRSGDGFIEGTECAVCLSEFEQNENLRVLPKCSHAFHLPCIDTWLKSHPNCPLCRANVVSAANPVAQMDRTGGNALGSSSTADLILVMDETGSVERNMNGGVQTNGGIRRSVSFHGRFLVSDMLVTHDEEMGMGTQEQSNNNGGQPGNVLRRSVSTGRFMFT